ncbi:hypothetical protein B7486_19285 [cyanobacterium TDX16]|nr:hypothetical protein B7486_19285 [cyanobacterium TDX16]
MTALLAQGPARRNPPPRLTHPLWGATPKRRRYLWVGRVLGGEFHVERRVLPFGALSYRMAHAVDFRTAHTILSCPDDPAFL